MISRRWLVLIVALAAVAGAVAVQLLPELIRRVAVARLEAATGRDVAIDSVRVSLLGRRLEVLGLRITDRGEPRPLAELVRLEVSGSGTSSSTSPPSGSSAIRTASTSPICSSARRRPPARRWTSPSTGSCS
jgi:hypothetical protein